MLQFFCVFHNLYFINLMVLYLVLCQSRFIVLSQFFSHGFNFNIMKTNQEIDQEERLQYDLFRVEWDVKLYLVNQSVTSLYQVYRYNVYHFCLPQSNYVETIERHIFCSMPSCHVSSMYVIVIFLLSYCTKQISVCTHVVHKQILYTCSVLIEIVLVNQINEIIVFFSVFCISPMFPTVVLVISHYH